MAFDAATVFATEFPKHLKFAGVGTRTKALLIRWSWVRVPPPSLRKSLIFQRFMRVLLAETVALSVVQRSKT
jgi:hypothetical protein